MKFLTGILFLIMMMIASFSASSEMTPSAAVPSTAEQQEPTGEGEDTSEDEEEPDCD